MKERRKVSAFPQRRLPRLPVESLEIFPRPAPELVALLARAAGSVAARWGLAEPAVRFQRQETLAAEQLRELFPGQWRFAVLLEPLAGRCAYLAVDPFLCSRLAAIVEPGRTALRGWWGELDGSNGLVGLTAAWMLDELCALNAGFSGWRYAGMIGSAGEIGRRCPGSRLFGLCWWRIKALGADGFAAWLEAEASQRRQGGRDGEFAPSPVALSLPVECRLQMGRLCLTAEQLASLRHGDILLFEPRAPLVLGLGKLRLRLEERESGFFVQGWAAPEGGEKMSEVKGDGWRTSGLEPQRLAEVPVELTVEAGRIRLSLQQVLALKAGDVLAVAERVLGPVEVLAGDKLIGRGELVDVEGRRGVRLLEVLLLEENNREGLA